MARRSSVRWPSSAADRGPLACVRRRHAERPHGQRAGAFSGVGRAVRLTVRRRLAEQLGVARLPASLQGLGLVNPGLHGLDAFASLVFATPWPMRAAGAMPSPCRQTRPGVFSKLSPMVRHEAKARMNPAGGGGAAACCACPTGESPVPVDVGAPGTRATLPSKGELRNAACRQTTGKPCAGNPHARFERGCWLLFLSFGLIGANIYQ